MRGTLPKRFATVKGFSYSRTVPRRPTVADVAREAGVSATTVSHALSGKGRVDATTREHVRLVAERLGYVPSRAARNLALGRSDTIGLLLPQLADMSFDELMRTDWYGRVATAASREALRHGRALAILPELTSAADLDAFSLEGVIVLDPIDDDPRTEMLRASHARVVILGRCEPDDGFSFVAPDIAGGITSLLKHLWDQGARSVGIVETDLAWSQGRDAVAAYRTWCEVVGMQPRVATASVARLQTRDSVASAGQEAAERLLAGRDRPDALVGLLEDFGRGIAAAARERGLGVPEDLMVAQDIDGLVAQVHEPPITALDVNVNALLASAVGMITSARKGENETIPVSLSVRRSTLRR